MLFHRKWILVMGVLALAPSVAMAGPFSLLKKSSPRPTKTVKKVVDQQAVAKQNQKTAEQIAGALRKAQLNGYDIDIQFSKGVATLKGMIANPQQWNTATEIVRSVSGVNRVDNQMGLINGTSNSVKQVSYEAKSKSPVKHSSYKTSGKPVVSPIMNVSHSRSSKTASKSKSKTNPNQVMAQRIASALKRTSINGYDIGIRYLNGEAQLQGTVSNQRQILEAQKAVSKIPGIKNVKNQLTVAAAPKPPVVPASFQPLPPQQGQPMPNGQPMPQVNGQPMPPGPTPGMSPMMNMPPMQMAGTYGQPPSSAIYNQPNLPQSAWPSYAQYPNTAAVNYPKQYSASAFPYIGPFYPYPQVPLGWRKASLEWDDGSWQLTFNNKTDRWWWFVNPSNW